MNEQPNTKRNYFLNPFVNALANAVHERRVREYKDSNALFRPLKSDSRKVGVQAYYMVDR